MAGAGIIELDRVWRSYDGGSSFAVQDLGLSVRAGELVALVGASGSGKTTALKMINRLVEPDRGEVRIEGQPVREVAAAQLRRRIGYVFQGVGLFPHMSVAENIASTPSLLGWPRPEIAARVAELLELTGLPAAFAGRPVRRSAPARRRGPRAGRPAGDRPDGRAVRRA